MRAWYAGGLRSRLAQAVAAGRVDAVKAADLHRLMTQLLERDLPHRTVVTAVARAGRRSST